MVLILVVLAFVFALLCAFNVPSAPRFNFLGASLACYFGSLLVPLFR